MEGVSVDAADMGNGTAQRVLSAYKAKYAKSGTYGLTVGKAMHGAKLAQLKGLTVSKKMITIISLLHRGQGIMPDALHWFYINPCGPWVDCAHCI